MEFEEFMVYTFLVLIGITIIISVINLIYNTRIIKRFSGKYVRILENYELQSEDLSSLFTITFFNNNMSDIKLHSFGIMYCDEQVDFYDEYVKKYHPNITKKLVIEPADSIKLQVNYERMKKMLLAIRNNRSGLPRIYGFIIDSNGNQTRKRLKDVRKNVKRIFKSELKSEAIERKETIRKAKVLKRENKIKQKEQQKEHKRKMKAENKERKANDRAKRRQNRIEKRKQLRESIKANWTKFKNAVSGFFMKLRSKFKKSNKEKNES